MTRTAVLKSSVRLAVLALVVGFVATPLAAGAATTSTAPRQWAAQSRVGDVQLKNEVPLLLDGSKGSASLVHLIGGVSAPAELSLNFGLPITNITGLNALIVAEARRTVR